jgi:hypothetical protein
MKGSIKEYTWILTLLVLCPLLTVFHGSVYAQEDGFKVEIERTAKSENAKTLEAVDVLIDEFSGLSEEEKAEVSRTLQAEFSDVLGGAEWDEDVIIPIAGILLGAFVVSIPVLIVILVLVFSYRKRRQRMELITKFIESGQAVPRELLADYSVLESGGSDEESNMKRGILLMGVGIGILIALGVLAGWEIGAIGLIPFFIGLARFIIWKLENKKVTAGEPAVHE